MFSVWAEMDLKNLKTLLSLRRTCPFSASAAGTCHSQVTIIRCISSHLHCPFTREFVPSAGAGEGVWWLPLTTLPSHTLWDQMLVIPGRSYVEKPKLCRLLTQQLAVKREAEHQLRARLAVFSPSFEWAVLISAGAPQCPWRYWQRELWSPQHITL